MSKRKITAIAIIITLLLSILACDNGNGVILSIDDKLATQYAKKFHQQLTEQAKP